MSTGAFYDDVPEHPEGALKWAISNARKHAEKIFGSEVLRSNPQRMSVDQKVAYISSLGTGASHADVKRLLRPMNDAEQGGYGANPEAVLQRISDLVDGGGVDVWYMISWDPKNKRQARLSKNRDTSLPSQEVAFSVDMGGLDALTVIFSLTDREFYFGTEREWKREQEQPVYPRSRPSGRSNPPPRQPVSVAKLREQLKELETGRRKMNIDFETPFFEGIQKALWYDFGDEEDEPYETHEIAEKYAKKIEETNKKTLRELFLEAAAADGYKFPAAYYPDVYPQVVHDYIKDFGFYITMMGLGQGVGWFDSHPRFPLKTPYIEVMYEDEDFTVFM